MVDEDDHVVGIVSLSDVLHYLVLWPAGKLYCHSLWHAGKLYYFSWTNLCCR